MEVLELVDAREPTGPAAGEVLVGVEYAPVNMNDLYVIQGAFPVRPSLPSFVGNEGVGLVLAVGSGVEHLKVGDRILIPLYAFSWRERLVVPAAGLFSLPDADPRQLAMAHGTFVIYGNLRLDVGMIHEEAFGDDALQDQVERVDRDRPPPCRRARAHPVSAGRRKRWRASALKAPRTRA